MIKIKLDLCLTKVNFWLPAKPKLASWLPREHHHYRAGEFPSGREKLCVQHPTALADWRLKAYQTNTKVSSPTNLISMVMPVR